MHNQINVFRICLELRHEILWRVQFPDAETYSETIVLYQILVVGFVYFVTQLVSAVMLREFRISCLVVIARFAADAVLLYIGRLPADAGWMKIILIDWLFFV